MKKLIDLSGKTIVVTGASSGIGRATAITLSEAGAKVLLTARREEELQNTLRLLSGSGHACYPFDLNELEQIKCLMETIVKEHGLLHGLAFCAGITTTRPYKITTPDVLHSIMKLNFYSFYEMARQFAKKKISRDGAKIVAVSSIASKNPDKGQAAYAASKAALDAAVSVLAQELLPRHINVNTVHPAFVRTDMSREFVVDSQKYNAPIQPWGLIEPEEIGVLITYLLSPAANMITASGVEIRGGYKLAW